MAEACGYSAIFIPYGKGSGSNRERYVGGTEQQEGGDISKKGKCRWNLLKASYREGRTGAERRRSVCIQESSHCLYIRYSWCRALCASA